MPEENTLSGIDMIHELDKTIENLITQELAKEEFGSFKKLLFFFGNPDDGEIYNYLNHYQYNYDNFSEEELTNAERVSLDVDESLKEENLGTSVVTDDLQQKEFSEFNQPYPIINLFLFKVEERKELRKEGQVYQWDKLNKEGTHQEAPIWVDCYYAIDVWVKNECLLMEPFAGKHVTRTQAEHWLFSNIIKILSRSKVIPNNYREGSLADESKIDLIRSPRLVNQQYYDRDWRLSIDFKVTLGIPFAIEDKLTSVDEVVFSKPGSKTNEQMVFIEDDNSSTKVKVNTNI